MNLVKKQRENRYRLGELFLETGLVDVSAVSEGLSISRRTSFPIGRVLVMTGWLDDHDVNCALQLQELLRDGTIDNGLAKDLLRFCHLNKVDINESFRLNGLTKSGDCPQTRLGRLFLAAGVIDENQLQQSNRESQRHETTLGGAMLLLRFITPKTLEGALNLQIMLRDNKVTFAEAIIFCKEMHERNVSLREVLGDNGKLVRSNNLAPRLGEFLVTANLVQPKEILIAAEIGTEKDNNIGRILMDRGNITERALEAALKLQEMIQNRVLTYRRAVKLLRLVSRLDVPLEQILEESESLDDVFKLLRRAEIVPERLVRDVAAEILDFEDTVAEALLSRGYINPMHARIGLACLEKVKMGEIDETKAAFLVHHCCKVPGQEMEMFCRINWAELKRVQIRQDLLA